MRRIFNAAEIMAGIIIGSVIVLTFATVGILMIGGAMKAVWLLFHLV